MEMSGGGNVAAVHLRASRVKVKRDKCDGLLERVGRTGLVAHQKEVKDHGTCGSCSA